MVVTAQRELHRRQSCQIKFHQDFQLSVQADLVGQLNQQELGIQDHPQILN